MTLRFWQGAQVRENPTRAHVLLLLLGVIALTVSTAVHTGVLSPSSHEESRQVFSPPLRLGPRGTRHTFPFTGRALAVEAQAGPHWFTVWVEVDGRPANALPKDNEERAYLNLYRPEMTTVRVTVARGLPAGAHQVTFISGRGDPVWAITALVTGEEGRDLTPIMFWGTVLVLFGVLGLLRQKHPVRLPRRFPPPLQTPYRWLLVATGASLPFAGWYIRMGETTFVVTEVLLLCALAAGVVGWARARGRFPNTARASSPTPTALPLPALLAIVLAAMVFSVIGTEDVARALAMLKGGVLFPVVTGVLVWHSSLATRKAVVQGLSFGAALLALIALTDLLTDRAIWVSGLPRVRGIFGSPNHLALVLVRALPFALILSRIQAPPPRLKWLPVWGPAVVIVLGLLFTASRGAWLLGIPVAVGSLLPSLLGPKMGHSHQGRMVSRYALIAGGMLTIGVLLAIVRGTGTWQQRWLIWQGVWRMIKAHPWTGIGLGQFPTTYPMYALPTAWREPLLYHAHNGMLHTAAVLGIPAALALAYLLGSIATLPTRTPVRQAARASLLGGLAFGMVDAFWALPDLAYLTALAVALLMPPPGARDGAVDHTRR